MVLFRELCPFFQKFEFVFFPFSTVLLQGPYIPTFFIRLHTDFFSEDLGFFI